MAQRVPAKAPQLDEPSDRLQWARIQMRFHDATAAARRYHWNENTYRSHENGTRGLSKKAADKYAKAFKVSVGWLLYGEGAMTPPIDPELANLWDDLTDDHRRDLLRYGKMLLKETG